MIHKIKKIQDIIVDESYVISLSDYHSISNKEEYFREIFIKILKDNYESNTLVKLVDIKKKYIDLLCEDLKNDESLIQILKNLIGSNKDNTTHLVRDPRVFWYFCSVTNLNEINVTDDEKKPFPLPKKLERSHSKKYFAQYHPIANDSIIETYLNEVESNSSQNEEYEDIDFTNLKNNKIDYVERQKLVQEIGKTGEEYAIEIEKKILSELRIQKEPIWVAKISDSYGFDILSFRKDSSGNIKRVYIEVKTTTGDLYTRFFFSKKELKVSSSKKDNYYLYRVYNASDEKSIAHKIYSGDVHTIVS